MPYDIGPKIGIDGEAEFRRSINNIITEMKTLGTEMRMVTSEFKDNADSQEALTKKNQILNKQLEAQKKRLALLEDGLEACAKKYGAADTKTMKWQQSVNQAKTDLYNLESELANNVNKLNDLEKGLDNTADALEEAGRGAQDAAEGFTIAKGALADLAADGMQAVISGAKDMLKSYDEAATKLQGQTGAAVEEMEAYQDVMEDIYASGYGESLEEVAEAAAEVKKQVKKIDSSELENMSKNALNLKKTFGYDVSESIRTANQLTKQFGITSEEAFDLIVAGAQNGLDQNGNLLDTLNEYSPKFKAIGLNADDMYNALISGAEAGVFDIDKLGDAINEFSIRILDGSDTTRDAFTKMGLDADNMAAQFAQGGESAKNAFKQTLKALESIEDPLDRNTAGVELFGSMWEDTGGEAILALGDIQDGINDTKGAMKKLDQINADNLSNKFATLGRTIQADVVYPILEDAYPAIEKIVDFTVDHLDEIIPLAKTAAAAMATIFVVNKASQFITSVKNVTSAVKGLTDATKAANVASSAMDIGLGTVIGKFGKFVPAATLVGGTVVSLGKLWGDTVDEWNEKAAEMAMGEEALRGLEIGANNWTAALQSATGYLDSFNTTLFATSEEQQVLSNNMQEVQDGITAICRTATEERRGYTEEEIIQLDQYFQKLNELQDQQYQVEVAKMEAISQAAMGYAQNQDMSYQQYQETAANWLATAQQQKEAMLALVDDQTIQEIALLNQRYGEQANMSNEAYANEYNTLLANAEQKKAAVQANMEELYEAYANGYSKITDETSIFNGRYGELSTSLELEAQAHVDRMNGISNKYAEGTKEYQDAVESYTAAHNDIMDGIWESLLVNMDSAQGGQLSSWLQMVADAQMHGAELDQTTLDMVNSLARTFSELPSKTRDTIQDTISPMLEGLKNSEPDLYAAAKADADSVIQALEKTLEINSPSRVTRRIFNYVGEGAIQGLQDKFGDIQTNAYDMAVSAAKSMEGYDLYGKGKSAGNNMAAGMSAGILEGKSSVIDNAVSMAQSVISATKRVLGIHSPSKVFEDEVGANMALGMEKGFSKTVNTIIPDMSKDVRATLEVPDLSGYRKESVVYVTNQVFLGNRELVNELTGGVVKKISSSQKNVLAAKGRWGGWSMA